MKPGLVTNRIQLPGELYTAKAQTCFYKPYLSKKDSNGRMKGLGLCLILLVLSCSVHAQQELDERLAREYSANGELEKAVSVYQKLYNDGAGPEYYDPYFSLLLQTRKFREAKDLALKMISRDASSPVYKVDLGRVYQQSGFKERTDSVYKALLRNLPRDEFGIREVAAAFYRANAYDYAVTTFIYGRKVLGEDQAFAFDLLALYRYQKNRALLIQEYIHVLSANSDPSILLQAQKSFDMLLESREDYALLEANLLKALKKKTQQPVLTNLLSWAYIRQEKFSDAISLLIDLDKKHGSGEEPIFNAGTSLLDRQEYTAALTAFEYIASKGHGPYYVASGARILYCRTELLGSAGMKDGEPEKLSQEYRKFIGETDDVEVKAFLLRKLAQLYNYQLKRHKEGTELLHEALSLPNLNADLRCSLKLDLGDVCVLTDDLWEATLFYSQVEKEAQNEVQKQEAQFRNARLSYYRGDFVWAQVQLNELKGATNQLLANDALNLSLLISEHTQVTEDTLNLRAYARADMFAFSKRFDNALAVLDSIEAKGNVGRLADDLLMLRARILLGLKDFSRAKLVLQQIADLYPSEIWADDALFMLGNTFEELKEVEKAKACYEKIITSYPGSLYISEARTRFRNLRGDSLG